jgi:hypothetical protein
LSAVTQEEQERTKEDILEDFFPLGLDELLQGRHLDSPLAESELEFLEASQTRRDFLMNEANNLDSIRKCKYRNLRAHLTPSRRYFVEVCLGRFLTESYFSSQQDL